MKKLLSLCIVGGLLAMTTGCPPSSTNTKPVQTGKPVTTAGNPKDEKRPDEKKPDEKKPQEKRPDEKKPDEKKPQEKRPDEKKPDEKKPGK